MATIGGMSWQRVFWTAVIALAAVYLNERFGIISRFTAPRA